MKRSMRTRSLSGRRRNHRGAALVESAIVLLPLCMIVFGIIEYGMVFKDSLTLSSATRAGARMASAMPESSSMTYEAALSTVTAARAGNFTNGDQIFVYKSDANGVPQSGSRDSCTTNCVRYVFSNGSWVANGGSGWPVANRSACLGGTIDTVGVSIRITHDSITGFFPFLEGMKLREYTAMRLEPTGDDC